MLRGCFRKQVPGHECAVPPPALTHLPRGGSGRSAVQESSAGPGIKGSNEQVTFQVSADRGTGPGHVAIDRGHGRIIRNSIWAASADGIDFPHAAQVMRIRRDTLDRVGSLLAEEIVLGITTLDAARGTPDILAALTRGHWGIESVHRIRDTAYAEDANTSYAGNGPQVMATLRNIAISLLHLAGITQINRTLQAISRNPGRVLDLIPL